MTVPQWTLTVPVEKSDREGGRYIIGVAAGPGVDAQFDRITPEAISRFNNQLADSTIPLRNFHKTDDITADLGEVCKAWITDEGELGVEILLDDDNKDSDFIWSKLNKGKQFGLSVHGDAVDYSYEYDPASATRVRVLNDVRLDEISITTRPAYTPSFGTVVRKSIDDAEREEALSKEQVVPVEEVKVEETTTTETVETTVETSTPEVPETVETPEVNVDVEKSISATTKQDAKGLAKFVANFKKMMEQAESLGLLSDEDAAEVPASTSETIVEHSVAAEESTVIKSLQDEITALNAWKQTVMEQIPSTELPPAQISKSDEFADLYSKMEPMERVRLGLALMEQGKK